MSYEIIWESHGAVKRFLGHVNSFELIQSVIDVERDARFDDLHYVINDFLGCTRFSIHDRVVEDMAVMDKGASFSNPDIKIAVVVTSPQIIAAAREYVNSELNVYPTRIFATEGEARAWLGTSVQASNSDVLPNATMLVDMLHGVWTDEPFGCEPASARVRRLD